MVHHPHEQQQLLWLQLLQQYCDIRCGTDGAQRSLSALLNE
jgi:hypothetical protein